jgi:hypothetical protein
MQPPPTSASPYWTWASAPTFPATRHAAAMEAGVGRDRRQGRPYRRRPRTSGACCHPQLPSAASSSRAVTDVPPPPGSSRAPVCGEPSGCAGGAAEDLDE